MRATGRAKRHAEPACESCGMPVRVRLIDGSGWCWSCHDAAHRLGYGGLAVVHVANGTRNHVEDEEMAGRTICRQWFVAYVFGEPDLGRKFCVRCERWLRDNGHSTWVEVPA